MARTLSTLASRALALALGFAVGFAGLKASAAIQCSSVFPPIDVAAAFKALAEFRLDLDLAQTSGVASINQTMLRANYVTKEKELLDFLQNKNLMNRVQFLKTLRKEISNLQNSKKEENSASEEERLLRNKDTQKMRAATIIDGNKMFFHTVKKGSFMMDPQGGRTKKITLTKSFELMATPTTQIMWETVARLYKKRFPKDKNLSLNPNPSAFKGATHPVESVTYFEIQRWIFELNQLSKMGEPGLLDLSLYHRKGDVYRLPTEAEWEFVIRGRGKFNDTYHTGNDAQVLADYAWTAENARNETHPVAQRLPLSFDGLDFYDMHGNVFEFTADVYTMEIPKAINPLHKSDDINEERTARGGSWIGDRRTARIDNRRAQTPDSRNASIGFRLVREVRP